MSIVAQTATLAHGYTMADADRIAHVAMRRHPNQGLDYADRFDSAWHAIAEELCTRADAPTFRELVCAALSGLDQERDGHLHHHGVTKDGNNAPKFTRYWLPVQSGPTDGFSDRLVEVLALPTVLSVLPGEQYEVLATLAAYDGAGPAAADALGMNHSSFTRQVRAARERIEEVWFEGETPRGKATGETCRSGHSRAEHGHRLSGGKWKCRLCHRASVRRYRARNRN